MLLLPIIMIVFMTCIFGLMWVVKDNNETRSDMFLNDTRDVLPIGCNITPIGETKSYIIVCDGKFEQLIR